jgi:hypothetical protein
MNDEEAKILGKIRKEREQAMKKEAEARRTSLGGMGWARGRLHTASSPGSADMVAVTVAGMGEASAVVRRTSARRPFSSSWHSSWGATRERVSRPAGGAVRLRQQPVVRGRRVNPTSLRGSPWLVFNIRAMLVVL